MYWWTILGLATACVDAPKEGDAADVGSDDSPAAMPDTDASDTPKLDETDVGPVVLLPDEDLPADTECTYVASGAGPAGEVSVRYETVVDGLDTPWSVVALPDGGALVTERDGRLRRIDDEGALVADPVATFEIGASSEGGLLGLALHPEFPTVRSVYVYVTVAAGQGVSNEIVRLNLSEDGLSATVDDVVVPDIPGERFHDGGRLRSGPLGMLWASTGDARDPARSRDPDSLAGKLLRFTPEGGVPADNPTPGSLVVAQGLRNGQGIAWLGDGRLVLTDHGPSGEFDRRGHDELNVLGLGGDLGWPEAWRCDGVPGTRRPAITWAEALPPGGVAVYTGDVVPAWKGDIIIGAMGSGGDRGHLQRVTVDAVGTVTRHETYFLGELGRIRDVYDHPDGHLWFTTSNCDGRGTCPASGDGIYRVVAGP